MPSPSLHHPFFLSWHTILSFLFSLSAPSLSALYANSCDKAHGFASVATVATHSSSLWLNRAAFGSDERTIMRIFNIQDTFYSRAAALSAAPKSLTPAEQQGQPLGSAVYLMLKSSSESKNWAFADLLLPLPFYVHSLTHPHWKAVRSHIHQLNLQSQGLVHISVLKASTSFDWP